MHASAETFLRKRLAKEPFGVKTILELVTFLKTSGSSRDVAGIVKTIQDVYASDFVKEHVKTLPVNMRERLDKFMVSSLEDFVELSQDTVSVRRAYICVPFLCSTHGMTAVVQLGEKVGLDEAAMKNITAEADKVVNEALNKTAVAPVAAVAVAAVTTEVQPVVAAAVETQEIVPVIVEAPAPVVSSESTSSESVPTTDVSGAQVETTQSSQNPVEAA
jgi:hypothetical protein